MFALFAAIILCNKKNNLTSVKHSNKRVEPLRVGIDKLGCYQTYVDVVNVVKTNKKVGEIKFKESPDTEYQKFILSCLGTILVDPCDDIVTAVAEATGAKATDILLKDFAEDCEVVAPKANSAECLSAYNTLIASVEEDLDSSSKKLKLKTIEADYAKYLKECETTTQTANCAAKLDAIVWTTGITDGDLTEIKKVCSVSAPPPPTSTGTISMKRSGILLLLISGLLKFFWVN
jgi:hypothetical protein